MIDALEIFSETSAIVLFVLLLVAACNAANNAEQHKPPRW